jgi:hypothetical protein
MMTWERITGSGIGWVLAVVILVFAWAAFAFGKMELPTAFVVSAICAVRL